MGFKPIILFSKVHKVPKTRVFIFKISNEKKKTRHKRCSGDSNPIAIDTLPKTTYVDDNCIFFFFFTHFMWNLPFSVQVVFRKSIRTSQLRTYKATIWKGSEALTFLQLPILYRLEAFWAFTEFPPGKESNLPLSLHFLFPSFCLSYITPWKLNT